MSYEEEEDTCCACFVDCGALLPGPSLAVPLIGRTRVADAGREGPRETPIVFSGASCCSCCGCWAWGCRARFGTSLVPIVFSGTCCCSFWHKFGGQYRRRIHACHMRRRIPAAPALAQV